MEEEQQETPKPPQAVLEEATWQWAPSFCSYLVLAAVRYHRTQLPEAYTWLSIQVKEKASHSDKGSHDTGNELTVKKQLKK